MKALMKLFHTFKWSDKIHTVCVHLFIATLLQHSDMSNSVFILDICSRKITKINAEINTQNGANFQMFDI